MIFRRFFLYTWANHGLGQAMQNIPGNLAILFADISGSTSLYEKLGDARALECIGLCLNIMREVTVEHGGRVIKTIGDEVMCVFPTVSAGAKAASDMQTRVSMQEPTGGQRLAIRVGLQYGPVLEQADDVFGDSVNVAARMASEAKAGQIVTTRDSVDAMPPSMRALIRNLGTVPVKGKEEDIAICEITWQHGEELTSLATRMDPGPIPLTRLRLRHGEREVVFGPEKKQMTLGRDASNDLVIADRKASRQHARIERRRDKYVLIDQSSNGTHLTLNGEPEFRIRREEFTFQGRGSISFGHPYASDPTEVVVFEVEG
jgi:adenylate cyclase